MFKLLDVELLDVKTGVVREAKMSVRDLPDGQLFGLCLNRDDQGVIGSRGKHPIRRMGWVEFSDHILKSYGLIIKTDGFHNFR